mmetsp:Transcript_36044/g.103656  ORF Transcript_36044/g.103656 Transcript_36044/m.103656 type:complete len:282 (-) Transcript_36044:339-1184(-)
MRVDSAEVFLVVCIDHLNILRLRYGEQAPSGFMPLRPKEERLRCPGTDPHSASHTLLVVQIRRSLIVAVLPLPTVELRHTQHRHLVRRHRALPRRSWDLLGPLTLRRILERTVSVPAPGDCAPWKDPIALLVVAEHKDEETAAAPACNADAGGPRKDGALANPVANVGLHGPLRLLGHESCAVRKQQMFEHIAPTAARLRALVLEREDTATTVEHQAVQRLHQVELPHRGFRNGDDERVPEATAHSSGRKRHQLSVQALVLHWDPPLGLHAGDDRRIALGK